SRKVVVAADDALMGSDAARAVAARGLACDSRPLAELIDTSTAPSGVIACAPLEPLGPAAAAQLAPLCSRAARGRGALVLLAAWGRAPGRQAIERAAALACLRAAGAVVCDDPDVWLETVMLLAAHGLPGGPRVAVVAPPGSWLAASAAAMAGESAGARPPPVARDAGKLGPTDIALVDRTALADDTDRVGGTLIVPVVGRAELVGDDRRVPLVGLRAALGAAVAAGRLSERLAGGLGPAPAEEADALGPDEARFARQLARLSGRAGDHETKVLLSAWGVRVVRQAVAGTASAANRIAKKAGYPVEIKPWSSTAPSEAEGCPVERDLHTAADVRRAFAAVARAADLPAGAPVIVRETPPPGRELRVRILRVGELGWTVIADAGGAAAPLAAPAPLRPVDAHELIRLVEATRADDPEPDREAAADLLVRASHLVVRHQQALVELELGRVLVCRKGEGALVVDARAILADKT
ncbi:MAG TPA: acetate--CoA ligase family protein, partial [Kofleriaceae bacterium]|nr:acetate--CoA ligase family protein [Kofleriaceae bacterium]